MNVNEQGLNVCFSIYHGQEGGKMVLSFAKAINFLVLFFEVDVWKQGFYIRMLNAPTYWEQNQSWQVAPISITLWECLCITIKNENLWCCTLVCPIWYQYKHIISNNQQHSIKKCQTQTKKKGWK